MNRKQKLDNLVVIGDQNGWRHSKGQRIKFISILEHQPSKSSKHKATNMPNFTKVYSQESYIAVIDRKQNAWLIGEQFPIPVNVSDLIRRKISRVILGEKQMIVEAQNQYILINWGSVKTLSQNLLKISTFNSTQNDSLFMAYLITQAEKDTFFYYNLEKKVQNSNRLFQIRNSSKEIIGYPTNTSIQTNIIVKGLSIGKYHSLCWDHQGNLYSWGCRSLALGYGHLPSEDLIERPKKVNVSKYILTAFAATHYSLAVTSQGSLYEWGIKMQFNEINEQIIFKPRQLDFRFFRCPAKFISLKGKDNNFAALSSSGQLYVWGRSAKNMLDPNIILPPSWHGSYIYEPVLQTDLAGCSIVDFTIEVNYIGVLLGNESLPDHSQQEYWKVLKERARKQLSLFKINRTNTENSEQLQKLKKKYHNPILCDTQTDRKHISIQAEERQVPKDNAQNCQPFQQTSSHQFKRTAPAFINSNRSSSNKINAVHHRRQVSDCFGTKSPLVCKINSNRNSQVNLSIKWIQSNRSDQKFSENYHAKLQGVLEKKRKLESLQMENHLKRIDQGSSEFRIKKRQQEQMKKRKQHQQSVLRQSLASYLVKSFLVKVLTAPLQEAREVKIGRFKRILVMNKVQKNIKKLFSDTKVKFSIQELRRQKLPRFILLALYFKNYVIKFRQRKRKEVKFLIAQSLTKRTLKEKVHHAILKINPGLKRIRKLTEWIHSYNEQRIKILKQRWNTYLLHNFKTSDGGKFNLAHLNVDASFQDKYNEALESNAIKRLADYYRGLTMPILRLGTKKSLSQLRQRKHMNKSSQQLKDKLASKDILPYSLHYNSFKRPKQFEIILNEAVKTSPYWVQTERTMVKEVLATILRKHDKQFIEKYRQYQHNLATFIHLNYDHFYEIRWKFIIEYNKTEKTLSKRKKEKQLRRLLSTVGMERLVDEDCIPEKHIVFEQALMHKDAPKPPNPILTLDLNTFDKWFRMYWQNMVSRSKQIKRKN